jgi:hypothetical protein
LACVGDMLKDEVLAFSVADDIDEREQPSPTGEKGIVPTGVYIRAKVQDFFDLWGPAEAIFERFEDGGYGRIRALHLRQGVLAIIEQYWKINVAHWSRHLDLLNTKLTGLQRSDVLWIGALFNN